MQNINTCECCNEGSGMVPAPLKNRPGLSMIEYRAGTHPVFKEKLLNSLSSYGPGMRRLTTRSNDDFTIGLLDAFSTMADVLTFYQERIANESYLRTATERFSISEMARLTGYQLQPGVAAGAFLSFVIEDSANAFTPAANNAAQAGLPVVTIPKATKIQSLPGPDEKPQIFETIETIEARADWNAMKPRQTQPQTLHVDMNILVVQGTGNSLKTGDVIVIAGLTATGANGVKLRKIQKVVLDTAGKTTRIELVPQPSITPFVQPVPPKPATGTVNNLFIQKNFTQHSVTTLLGSSWREADIAAVVSARRWSVPILAFTFSIPPPPSPATLTNGVQVFRKRVFFFGYNAPLETKYGVTTTVDKVITKTDLTINEWDVKENSTQIFLDSEYDEVLPGSIIAVQVGNKQLEKIESVLNVRNVDIRPRSEYGLSTKSTVLTVDPDWRSLLPITDQSKITNLRTATIYAQNEPLILAEIPIEGDLTKNNIELDRYYSGLRIGQKLILTGTRSDLAGVIASEVLTISEVRVDSGMTVLGFEKDMQYPYLRNTITISGNVAPATQGESVTESLGSGDASKRFQKFALKQPPLTHISAASASGAISTLEVRVNDILWHEVSSLLYSGPQDKIYITRLDNDGKTTVMFGDGVTGARLPTGPDNVRARYRKGIGLEGVVRAGQLSQLLSRPLGVKSVNNPIAASGAANPEAIDDARRNAPLQILTLGRIVSLQDYTDFARAFAGIEKAHATWSWSGQRRRIVITVAGTDGASVEPDRDPGIKFLPAVRNAGDPNVSVSYLSYNPAYFQLTANVKVSADYIEEKVFQEIEVTLKKAFSFAARDFGQSVSQSQLLAVIQQVPGVIAAELDALYRTDRVGSDPDDTSFLTAGLTQPLDAGMPVSGDEDTIPAELLMIDPRPVTLQRML